MRRETCGFIQITLLLSISIHSPHARGDDVGDHESGYRRYFNPLPSCEGRLEIPLVRGQVQGISIHSPHARGDIGNGRVDIPIRISIHSPHARGDGRPNRTTKRYYPFQSTPLMRGETRVRALRDLLLRHFNPLPSCEGRRNRLTAWLRRTRFQSTPLMRGETDFLGGFKRNSAFQSTPLMRGETTCSPQKGRGARGFQSTPLMRGETPISLPSISAFGFQSTPLMRGETYDGICGRGQNSYFNPLPSCEGRRYPQSILPRPRCISIHSPHARGDLAL